MKFTDENLSNGVSHTLISGQYLLFWKERARNHNSLREPYGSKGGREPGINEGGKFTGGGRRGAGSRKKWNDISQHCAIFRSRKST